jgi:hypothetical protein
LSGNWICDLEGHIYMKKTLTCAKLKHTANTPLCHALRKEKDTWNKLCCLLPIEKILNSNSNLIITLTSNLTASFSTLWNIYRNVLICKHGTWQNVQNSFKFLSQPSHIISWHIGKSHNFQTPFAFFRIYKSFGHTIIWSCF